ncbi:putative ribonuclease H-like domain-containing protein [Tanacetum coccineum]
MDLPHGKRAIGTKWVYKNKTDERGIVIRNKARLVAQGYTQEDRIDYDGVFAPVARIEAIRLFLAYASFKYLVVYQMDVKSAFLYGKIEEEVYVCQPLGFEDPEFPDRVYKVEKALYGLHQAPRAWYETLSTYLLDNGFQRGQIDKTLFIKRVKSDILLVQVYVDDIIFGSTKKMLCTEFEKLMHKKFQMSSMGELTFFLGLQVTQKDDGIFINQDKYVDEILKKFGFSTVKTTSTPMETSKPLLKDEEAEDVDVHLYRSMIGSLMYLTSSRHDIMFVVCACARFQVTPKVSHLHDVKRIFRYLKGKPKLGLWYPKDSPFDLEAYTDSDYAGASLDRKSTTEGCQFLVSRLISWQCKKQTVVANSTTEVEYVGATNCCGQHIEIRHHFIRDSYEKRLIQVIKIHTDHNVADLLTKAFDVSLGNTIGMKLGFILVTQELVLLASLNAAGRKVSAARQKVNADRPKIVDFLNASPIRYALTSGVLTRRMTKTTNEQGFISVVYKGKSYEDLHTCLFACFLSQKEPKKVWTLMDLPLRKRAIGTKWVYRNKKDKRGIVIRNKERLVAQGYTQEEGIDYDEVFAPVARIEAIRLFLAYALFKDFVVYQMDVKSAFLYGKIEEEVYVCQPLGFEDPEFPDRVYKVEKIDKTLFIKRVKSDILLVQVYVDDIIFGSTKKKLCTEFEKLMHKKFQMSSMGELTFFLGLQVTQKDDGIFISQDKYVDEILKKFGFSTVKTASTPMETSKPLLKDAEAEDVDVHLYRSMIGSLMYLTSSRPDIMFVVCACARFQVTPKVSHLHAVKRIFRYLKGQPKLGLWYPKDSPFDLEAYSDSDYAGASLDRKSTTGGCQFLGSRLISWQCKKQTVVANSTTEAEYVAAASCCGQVL